jgi:predicted transcriptional regulator
MYVKIVIGNINKEVKGMGYSIGEVARMLEISTQSLRIWEKDSGFPNISRNLLSRRRYTDSNIEAIRNFAVQKNHSGKQKIK